MSRRHPWEAQAQATETGGEKALTTALRAAVAAGAVRVTLLADGFTITTGEQLLHQVARTFPIHTPKALARYLGLPAPSIHDARRPETDPHAQAH